MVQVAHKLIYDIMNIYNNSFVLTFYTLEVSFTNYTYSELLHMCY